MLKPERSMLCRPHLLLSGVQLADVSIIHIIATKKSFCHLLPEKQPA